ncbi:MAG: hypothetical protein KBS58_00015 [Bacteroidales bacterium]|nr:hypothetical protein [Candidatus Cacconaster equi]
MKNIFRSILAVAVVALSVAACNVDNIKEVYLPSDDEISFAQSVIVNTEINAQAKTLDIELTRTSTDGLLQVPVDVSKLPEGVTCPVPSATFADGEATAAISLNVEKMEVGVTYKGTLSLIPANTTGGYQENIAITSASLTLAKAFTWKSLGKGQFCEAFWEGFFSECEVLKAEGFERYKFINPYGPSTMSLQKPANVEIWVINEETGNVKWTSFNTGFDYDDNGHFIMAYWPSDQDPKYAAKEALSGFYEKDIIVLVPTFYMDGIGGWPSKNYPIAFCLPGRTQASFEEWLVEHGIW